MRIEFLENFHKRVTRFDKSTQKQLTNIYSVFSEKSLSDLHYD